MFRKNHKLQYYLEQGVLIFLSAFFLFVINKLRLFDSIGLTKERLKWRVKKQYKNTVQIGVFKDLKILDKVWWGQNDITSKIFGEYEKHIVCKLDELKGHSNNFIDIGAADGFFAVGSRKNGLFECCYCYEITRSGQETIKKLACLNGVDSGIIIYGEAKKNSLRSLVNNIGSSVILCDIEGGEFELFDYETLYSLRKCFIIIELHDNVFPEYSGKREKLISNASDFFTIGYIDRINPNIYNNDQLYAWSDIERLIAFDECRPSNMSWLFLSPKDNIL